MGGKRQSNILSSVITNFQTVEDVIQTSMESSGSAIAENEKYLDSIQGRLDLFSNSLQKFWSNMLNSETIKTAVDFGTGIINLLDTAHGKVIALVAAVKLMAKFKGFSLKGIGTSLVDSIRQITAAQQTLQTLGQTTKIGKGYDLTNIQAYAQAVSNLTAKQQANLLASQGLNKEQIRYALTLNQVDEAAAREAMAHVHAATAKEQEAISGSKLVQQKALEVAASLRIQAAKDGETRSTELNAAADILEQTTSKNLTQDKLVEIMTSKGISSATQAEILAKMGLTNVNYGLAASIKAIWTANPVGFVLTVISTVLSLIPVVKSVAGTFAKSSEEITQSAQEAKREIDSLSSSFKQDAKTVNDYAERFAELAQGVDMLSGKNISLTADDYEEFLDLSNQLAEIFPTLSRNYDENGNAIVQLSGDTDTMVGSLEALLDVQRQITNQKIAENLPDLFAGVKLESDGYNTSLEQLESQRDEYINRIKILQNDVTDAINQLFNDGTFVVENNDAGRYLGQSITKILSDANLRVHNFVKKDWLGNVVGYTYKLGVGHTDEEIAAAKAKIASGIDTLGNEYTTKMNDLNNEIETTKNKNKANWSSLLSSIASWLSTDSSYKILDDEMQSVVQTVINNIDFSNLDNVDTWEKMQEYIQKNILSVFTNKNLGKTVAESIKGMFDLQSQLQSDDITIDEYKEKFLSFVDTLNSQEIDPGVLDQIKQMFNLDLENPESIGKDIDTLINHAKELVAEGLQDQIYTLSYSDLQLLYQVKADTAPAITSMDALKQKIKEVRAAMTEDFTVSNFTDYADSISTLQENISAYQEALEKLESGSFTITDFVELIKQFPELGKGVDASSKSFKGLDKNLRKAIKNSPKTLIKDLKQLRQQLVEAGKSTDAIDQLIDSIENMPDDVVENLAKHFGTLADEISRANRAQSELSNSLDGDTNDNYETRVKAYEEMIKLFNAGAIGSESKLWDISKFFFGNNPKAVVAIAEKNADALWELVEARQEWYTLGDNDTYTYDGIESFIKYVADQTDVLEKFGATWTYADGVFNFDLNNEQWEEFAHAIGLSAEEFSDLMVQVGQFFKINWTNAGDYEQHLNKVNQQIADIASDKTLTAKKKLEELNGVMQDEYGLGDVDLTIRPKVDTSELENAGWGKQEEGTATVYSSTYYKSDFGDLQPGESDAAIVLTPILPDGTVLSPEQLKTYAGQLLNGEKIDISDGITLGIFEGDDFKEKADLFAENLHKAQSVWLELSQSVADNPLELTFDNPENLVKQLNNLKVEATWDGSNITIANLPEFEQVLHDNGYTPETISQIFATLFHNATDETTLDFTNSIASIDAVNGVCQESINALNDLGIAIKSLNGNSQGAVLTVDSSDIDAALSKLGYTEERIAEIKQQWEDSGITINVSADTQEAETGVFDIPIVEDQTFTVTISNYQQTISDLQAIDNFTIGDKSYTVTKTLKTIFGFGADVNGTAHVSGTAHANGSWGAPKTETALVGELGPEIIVDPKSGKWHTVGDTGAEFTTVPKGAIVFNHIQTEQLLKNGYVTGRGKAYSSGTAYASISDSYKTHGSTNGSGSGKGSGSSADDAKDEFEEIFDWIEVRLEEINKQLDLKNARLDNSVGFAKQNAVINEMLKLNEKLYDNLIASANKYYEYSKQLLEKVPAEYRQAAQDGSIAIEEFAGEADEKTLEAIKDFREWVQKGDDAVQQAEEVITEVSSLAKQAIDNIATDFENKNSIRDNIIDQLDAYNALTEAKYGSESDKIYQAIIKETNKNIKTLETQRDQMQAELNKQVEAGNIQKYSQDWYDAVNDIAAVDTEIINLTADTYDYQDSINELHWDHFDNLLSRLEAISDEADNLIDILGDKDLVNKDTAKWTNEGITTLGLYAQKMEVAEMQAKKYKEEIDYLNKNWKKLGYTEQEYVEKLEELKDGQYDSIKAYNDTKKAIVDLNKTRVDAIKDGIQKEIDAYEELISKKKEELDADKDAHDWQKAVADKQKNISDIERKIAALSADNSATARAQRAKLQAELAEAQADLDEAYYDRSITDQQNALDKELENFKENKDKEIEGWEQYLENTEQVVADSLFTVQSNTDKVYKTLKGMGEEYSLSIATSLTSPWKNGESAIQSFSEKFGLSMSSTVEELQKLADEYKKVMDEIDGYGNKVVEQANQNASRYQQANNPAKPKFENTETVVKPVASSSGSASSSQSSKSLHAGEISGISATLKQGSSGSDVRKLQQALNNLGFDAGEVDGKFGYYTKQAVMRFQSSSKYGGAISADGIVGPNTKKKFKAAGYAKGTSGVKKNQLALIDELGEELQLVPDGNGRLAYLKKGTAVIPHDISENLMQLGQLNPQDILDRNRPTINAPHITNNETVINIEYGDVLHIENFNGDKPEDLSKIIDKAFDKHMKQLNSEIRKYTR